MESREHFGKETPNLPLRRSESRGRSPTNITISEQSRRERSSSLIRVRGRSPDTVRERSPLRLFPNNAIEPAAIPGPARTYQPEPSISANPDSEYSGIAFLSTTPHSERIAFAQRSRTWHSDQPNEESACEEFISLGVYETGSPSIEPLKCRFCSKGLKEGELLTVCECKNDSRYAHKKCLLDTVTKYPNIRCYECDHIMKIQYTKKAILSELEKEWSSNRPTSPNEESTSPRVRKTGYAGTRTRCRFCLQGENKEKLITICKCDDNSRFAHSTCLLNMTQKNVTRCRFCDHRFVSSHSGKVTLAEDARPSSSDQLVPTNEKSVSSKYSTGPRRCRFCFQGEHGEKFINVCRCKNNARLAHKTCLQIALNNKHSRCHICRDRFIKVDVERPTKELDISREKSEILDDTLYSMCQMVWRLIHTPYMKMMTVAAVLIIIITVIVRVNIF